MPKKKTRKEEEVKRLTDCFKEAKSVVFTNFDGLTVAESEELREKLRQKQVIFRVSKKTLLKKALAKIESKDIELDNLRGNVAVAFATEDEVAPARVLANFAKDHERLHLNFGILEGKLITLEKIKELALLPSKIELIAKTVATIKAPLSGLANVFAGNLRGLVNVFNAIKDKKQS
ncbi:50S ribosomal protein L10 [Patescibacteria group bacterium]|nr:50S ribosomal protein L10 [Patescibacteria group bacterium]